MKLIIDIDEDAYKEVKEDTYSGTPFENRVFSAIANGTSLGSLVYDIKKDIDENAEMSEDANYYLTRRDIFEIIDKHAME